MQRIKSTKKLISDVFLEMTHDVILNLNIVVGRQPTLHLPTQRVWPGHWLGEVRMNFQELITANIP